MYGSCREKCKKWLAGAEEHADIFAKLYPEDAAPAKPVAATSTTDGGDSLAKAMDGVAIADAAEDDEDKKHQTRGGKGLPRDQSTKLEKEAQKRAKAKVTITMAERNRRKAITNIRGLEAFGTPYQNYIIGKCFRIGSEEGCQAAGGKVCLRLLCS
jgi:hypothetical protein